MPSLHDDDSKTIQEALSMALPGRRGEWRQHIIIGETVLLIRNAHGRATEEELRDDQRYCIAEGKGGIGIKDKLTNEYFASPTALCKARFMREGRINEWRGPSYCLVQRGGKWIQLGSLGPMVAEPPPTPPRRKPRVAPPCPASPAPSSLEIENAALRAELEAVRAELAAAKAQLNICPPRAGPATPALAAILRR